MLAQSVRKRAQLGRTKSKRGCVTCKIRRVKCDETRPSCQRCTSTGRRCDGYQAVSPPPEKVVVVTNSLSQYLPRVSTANDRERRAFDFFLEQTAPTLSGPLDSKFWLELIPQLSQSVPAIWDALISISSLVEHPQWNSEPPDGTRMHLGSIDSLMEHLQWNSASDGTKGADATLVDADHQWALHMYNRSIAKVNKTPGLNASILPITIIASVLFICVEFLQDNVQHAMKLLWMAQKLVTEFLESEESSELGIIIRDIIQPLFIRLSVMVSFDFQKLYLKVMPLKIEPKTSFVSLSEARTGLYSLVASFHGYYARCEPYNIMENRHQIVPSDLRAEQEYIISRLHDWHRAFSILHREADPKALDVFATSVCLILYNVLIILISNSLTPYHTSYDSSMPLFENIIRQAEMAIKASPHSRSRLQSEGRPSFAFESNLVSPLYFVAIHCRHPELRRSAVRLIRSSPSKDGLSKADVLARMAEIAIRIEEEGLESSPGSYLALPDEQMRIHHHIHQCQPDPSEPTGEKKWFFNYIRYSKDENDNWVPVMGSVLLDIDENPPPPAKLLPDLPPKYRFKQYTPRARP